MDVPNNESSHYKRCQTQAPLFKTEGSQMVTKEKGASIDIVAIYTLKAKG